MPTLLLNSYDTVSSRKIIINCEEFGDDNYESLIASYIKYDIKKLDADEHKQNFKINESALKLVKNED